MNAARAALCGALVVATASRVARAASDSTPSLVVEQCPSLDEERLRTLVGLELATVAARGARRVRLTCAGARVTIEVRRRGPEAPRADPPSRVDLDLGAAAPGTRERILALAITEQLALDSRADAPPVLAPPVLAPPVLAPPRASETPTLVRVAVPVEEPPARWRLDARAAARMAARPSIWLLGGGVSLERSFSPFIGGVVELVAESGDAATSIATVTMRDLEATAGVSIGAHARRWSWEAIPGFTAGFVHLAASPRDATATGESVDGVWAGPSLGARARCALSRRVFVVAAVTGGLTTRRVSGLVDGQTALFEVRGPWLSLGAGLGATF